MKGIEAIDLVLLNAARKEHNADWNWKNVNSPFYRMYMVESGSARIILPDGIQTICPGYLYIVPPFITHSYENHDFFVLYYIHIYDKSNLLDLLDYPIEVKASDFDYTLIERLLLINPGRELLTSNPLRYDNSQYLIKGISNSNRLQIQDVMETKGILMQLFSRFMTKAFKKQIIVDDRIEKAVYYIRTHIDSNINIKELANHCAITSSHFIRRFKQELQCTPLQYINQKKIEKAELLLVEGKNSIKEIALSLSFSDISYFCKLFKKKTGFSPNQYVTNVDS